MFGENIKRYRLLKGMSLRDFGEAVNMSQTAIQKYEKGIITPDGEKLILFANVLECSVLDLVKDNSTRRSFDLKFRKTESLSGRKLNLLNEKVNDELNKYLDVLELNNIEKQVIKKYRVDSLDDAEKAAYQFRIDNNLNELLPLTNLCNIIENLGIYVVIINNDNEYFKGFDGISEIIDGYPFVCISSCINYYRQRFTLAHELGHLVLDINETLDEEKACNEFASSLLLPKKAMEQEFGKRRMSISDREYEIVRDNYQASIKAIIYRNERLGIISSSNAKLGYINFNKKYKELEANNVSNKYEYSRKYEQLVLRLYNQEIITTSRFNELMKGRDSRD